MDQSVGWTVVEATRVDKRRVRVFLPANGVPDLNLAELAETQFADEDDLVREPEIRRLAAYPLRMQAYPTIADPDALQTYVLYGHRLIFATTLVTRNRLRSLVAEGHPVVEGMTLQVMDADRVTAESVHVALHAWFERVFPDAPRPQIHCHTDEP